METKNKHEYSFINKWKGYTVCACCETGNGVEFNKKNDMYLTKSVTGYLELFNKLPDKGMVFGTRNYVENKLRDVLFNGDTKEIDFLFDLNTF